MAKTAKKPTPSILTPKQQAEYTDVLEAGVPEVVVKEFDERLDEAEQRWSRELRRAVRTGTPAIPR
jgi:hypothetical protein